MSELGHSVDAGQAFSEKEERLIDRLVRNRLIQCEAERRLGAFGDDAPQRVDAGTRRRVACLLGYTERFAGFLLAHPECALKLLNYRSARNAAKSARGVFGLFRGRDSVPAFDLVAYLFTQKPHEVNCCCDVLKVLVRRGDLGKFSANSVHDVFNGVPERCCGHCCSSRVGDLNCNCDLTRGDCLGGAR